jgi:hypothetical protein
LRKLIKYEQDDEEKVVISLGEQLSTAGDADRGVQSVSCLIIEMKDETDTNTSKTI